jgi:YbgC/YbaW family acyl-CoA thioester hydrolase
MSVLQEKVQWGDCAPSGAVFYPTYFRWFDEGAWELFASLKLSIDALGARYGVVGLPLKSCDCEFRGPCRLGDVLFITSFIEEIGSSELVVRHDVTNEEALAVIGRERRLWGVRRSDEPRRLRRATIPDEVVAILRGSLEAHKAANRGEQRS